MDNWTKSLHLENWATDVIVNMFNVAKYAS